MRILLVTAAAFLPQEVPRSGGAPKANRCLLESLAARGHDCAVFVPVLEDGSPVHHAHTRGELAARGIGLEGPETVVPHRGVRVHLVSSQPWALLRTLGRLLREFDPEVVLVAAEDPSHLSIQVALERVAERTVYLVQTTAVLPFGPASTCPSPAVTAQLEEAAGVAVISEYLREYLRRYAGLDSTVLRLPVFGEPPFPDHGRFDAGFVTMINPSGLKGVSVFRELARARPDLPFAAVPLWATAPAELRSLEALPNVALLPAASDVDAILARSRLLLVPSLWSEAFGYVCVDAMLRGIPVLASDVGGLPEAKLGVDYLLPVEPIVDYGGGMDAHQNPVGRVPEQDVRPWLGALDALVSDPEHYRQLSRESRRAAHRFLEGVRVEDVEAFLRACVSPARVARPA